MKIKTHILQFAMALCAVTFFSFTAQAVILPDSDPGAIVKPHHEIDPKPEIEPLPAIQPPVDSGTYNGTVMD